MLKENKKILILTISFFIFFGFLYFISARELEIKYPEATFQKTDVPISTYVNYIYSFTVSIIGIVSLLLIIIGGLSYSTSAGDPNKKNEAKRQIISAITGLSVILFSWLILRTIDPSFVGLKNPDISPTPEILDLRWSPILFCKEEINDIDLILNEDTDIELLKNLKKITMEKCISIRHATNWDGLIKAEWRNPEIIYILPPLYEEKNYHGLILMGQNREGQIVYNITEEIKRIIPMEEDPFLAYPFTMFQSEENSYSNFIREVQFYRYIGAEDNPSNPKPDDENYESSYGPYSTKDPSFSVTSNSGNSTEFVVSEGLPIKEFGVYTTFEDDRLLRIESLKISSLFCYFTRTESNGSGDENGNGEGNDNGNENENGNYGEEECDLIEDKPAIIVLYSPFCSEEITSWDEGRSCKMAIITSSTRNLKETDARHLCHDSLSPCIMGFFIISGYFTL